MTADTVKPLNERMEHLAAKLQVMWGRNPDTDLIREAIEALNTPTPETKTKRVSKKESK